MRGAEHGVTAGVVQAEVLVQSVEERVQEESAVVIVVTLEGVAARTAAKVEVRLLQLLGPAAQI